ncbi:hypothetical protein GCM10028778_07990 [Barrientosiimonas marina]|uniref:hypothetical protein n=1 Tax=Lentibacillus kimchii TaxID=1542911 RepID=UPI0036D34397
MEDVFLGLDNFIEMLSLIYPDASLYSPDDVLSDSWLKIKKDLEVLMFDIFSITDPFLLKDIVPL